MKITKKNIHSFEVAAVKLTGGHYVLPRKKATRSTVIAERKAMSRFISEHKATAQKSSLA